MFHTNVYKGVHHLSGLGNGKWTVVDGQTIFFCQLIEFYYLFMRILFIFIKTFGTVF